MAIKAAQLKELLTGQVVKDVRALPDGDMSLNEFIIVLEFSEIAITCKYDEQGYSEQGIQLTMRT
jgi:hypothetical protein